MRFSEVFVFSVDVGFSTSIHMESLISSYILSECWLVGPYSRQWAPSAKFYHLAQTSSYATGHNSSNNGFFKLVEALL